MLHTVDEFRWGIKHRSSKDWYSGSRYGHNIVVHWKTQNIDILRWNRVVSNETRVDASRKSARDGPYCHTCDSDKSHTSTLQDSRLTPCSMDFASAINLTQLNHAVNDHLRQQCQLKELGTGSYHKVGNLFATNLLSNTESGIRHSPSQRTTGCCTCGTSLCDKRRSRI